MLFANGYGSLLKAQLLVSVGMVCSGTLVYVTRLHDPYGRGIGNVMLDAAKTLSHSISFIHVAGTKVPTENAEKLERHERARGEFKTFPELLRI